MKARCAYCQKWSIPVWLPLIIGLMMFLIRSVTPWSALALDPRTTPHRIISLAPNITEIIFALGQGDRLVGVTRYCDEPAAARKIEKIGGFTDPNLEKIIALKPDLILSVKNGMNRPTVQRLEQMGLRLVVIEDYTLDQIHQGITTIGRELACPEKARTLVASMSQAVEQVRQKTQAVTRRRVAVVLARSPYILAGSGTYPDELVNIAGGQNIVIASNARYPRYTLEKILADQPEVIIDISSDQAGQPTANLATPFAFWSKWTTVPAVKERRVYRLSSDALTVPGPRIIQVLYELASKIHPEIFNANQSGPATANP
jgi:iron complex transport system substrate-binding protein